MQPQNMQDFNDLPEVIYLIYTMSKVKIVKHYVEYLIINSSLLIGFDEKLLPMHSLVYY